jgi:hypothetical protein
MVATPITAAIADRLAFLPLLYAFRPADFGSLITWISYGVVSDRVEPSFLLGEAEDMLINPILQTEMKRPQLGCSGRDCAFTFDKSRTTGVESLNQPIRNAVLHFQDRANPLVELLPIDVMISCLEHALRGDAARLIFCPLAGEALQAVQRPTFRRCLGFLQVRNF